MRKQDEAILFEVLRHPLYGSLGHLRVRESGMEKRLESRIRVLEKSVRVGDFKCIICDPTKRARDNAPMILDAVRLVSLVFYYLPYRCECRRIVDM